MSRLHFDGMKFQYLDKAFYIQRNIKIQPNLKFNLSIKNIYIFGNNFPENVGVNK